MKRFAKTGPSFEIGWAASFLIALALSAIGLGKRPAPVHPSQGRASLDQPSQDWTFQDRPFQGQPSPGQSSPDPGRWQEGAPIPVPIAEIAAGEIDGVIYTGGGFTPPAGSVSLWFGAYDTTDDAWQRRADLPLAVHHPGMVAAAGKVWQSGGYTAQLNVNNANRRLDAYDPARDAWTRMADMPGRRGAHAAVYIAGGEGAGEGGGAAATGRTYGEHYVFDPVVGSWHESAAMPTTRHGIAAAAVGQRFNVIGGGRIAGLDCSTLVEWWEPGRSGSVLLPFVARTGHAGDLRDLDPSPYRINNHPHYPIPIQRTEPCWKPAS